MTSNGKKLTADAGIGKFVQLTGKETDEEIAHIVNVLSAALKFSTERESETDEQTGASSNASSDGIQVEPETVLDVTKQSLGEGTLPVAIGNPNVKIGAMKYSPSADQEWNRLTDDLALCLANLHGRRLSRHLIQARELLCSVCCSGPVWNASRGCEQCLHRARAGATLR